MPYSPNTWNVGDKITKAKLDRLEQAAATGADGVQQLSLVNDWEPKRPYKAGDRLTRFGVLYEAIADHTPTATFNSSLYRNLGAFRPPVQSLTLRGNYDGGTTTDSTPVLRIVSHQKPISPNYGEGIRLDSMRRDAKNFIAWRLPMDPELPESASNPMRTVAWAGAHWASQDDPGQDGGYGLHAHWAVEVPNSAGVLVTKFEIKFADMETGKIGADTTLAATNGLNFVFSTNFEGSGPRIEGVLDRPKQLAFSTQIDTAIGLASGVRWKAGIAAGDVETPTSGANWRLDRFDTAGAFLGTAIHVHRHLGRVAFGASSVQGGQVTAAGGDTSSHSFLAKPSALGSAYANYGAETLAAADRIVDAKVAGDAGSRMVVFLDKIEWGPAGARDTSIGRLAAGVVGTLAGNTFKTGRGATAARPAAATVGKGAQWFDETLNKPIWSNGTAWTDATGATV